MPLSTQTSNAETKPSEADQLLDDLARRAWDWFEINRHPRTGMVRDRAPNWPDRGKQTRMCSVAANGYYLSLLPEAVRLKRLTPADAERRAAALLEFSLALDHHHGLLFHFIDWETGRRWAQSEYSLLDTAIFLNGCMVVASAFPRVAKLADQLLDRVNWKEYFRPTPRHAKPLLAYGWEPPTAEHKGRFSAPADVRSSENLMPCLLAAGSRTSPVTKDCWYNMRIVRGQVEGRTILNPAHALFTSYYGLNFADLRGLHDADGIDLHENARLAADANRDYCLRPAAHKHATYRAEHGGWWGLSAGDSPRGYVASGPVDGDPDGTVWPTAALAALPWAPALLADLFRWRNSSLWPRVNGTFGLAPFAIQTDRTWVGDDLIAIDLGSFAVSLANHRNRTVWDLWMQHPVGRAGLKALEWSRP